jgi:hypothetical protein
MPSKEEIAAIRTGKADAPPNFENLLQSVADSKPPALDNNRPDTPTARQEPAVTPPAQQQGQQTQEPDLPQDASPKARESWDNLKKKHSETVTTLKKELDEARAKLNESIKTGTPTEQAVAHEEYEKLKGDYSVTQSKLSQYEIDLKLEREQREKIQQELKDKESKLARLSLDFDPDFQERYVKPFDSLQTKLAKEVKVMSDSKQVADQVNAAIYHAVQQGDDEAFYEGMRALREIDPQNYGTYAVKVQGMRDLLIDRLKAMENHEATAQQLRSESYRTRERTVPEVTRKLYEVRQDIGTAEAALEAQLTSEPFRNFLKQQNIDPDNINAQLDQAVRQAHTTGEVSKELLYFAAQGARKLQITPLVSFIKDQNEALTRERDELKAQLDSVRGSSSQGRPLNGQGGAFEPLAPPARSASEIRRMRPEDREAAKRSAFAGLT